ncbi:MAG: hypothetical protein OEQ39_20695 [Gammaproteobacteria bacterium]|nr:hypothetical protein [Gammaproteobacteria bacterium]
MKLLEQLRQEHAQRKKGEKRSADDGVRTVTVSQAVLWAIETLYSNLTDLAEGLNQLEIDVCVDYEIEFVGKLSNLHQRSYAVHVDDAALPRFVLVFDCIGNRPLTRFASTQAERERAMSQLDSFGLSFGIDGSSAIRYAISVKPIVPVRLEFTPTLNGNEVRLTAYNLNCLGRESYSIHPDEVTEELIDELGKLIMRRKNRFAQLTGNYISDEARERLRSQLRVAEGAKPRRENRTPNGTYSVAPSKVPRTSRRTPIFIAHNSQAEGWVSWDAADSSTAKAPAKSTRGELDPHVFRLTRYAWVITSDSANPDPSESIAKRGPAGTSQAFPTPVIVNEGDAFRLMNTDGEIRYCGMILGKYNGFEPMSEFGRQHGCCYIEYLREGKWVRLDPTE